MSDLIADHTCKTVNSVRFFSALRNSPLRRVTLWSIAAGGNDRSCSNDHSRAGNDALFYRLLESNVCIPCAFGSQITNGREARLERVAQVICRSGHAQAERLACNLI